LAIPIILIMKGGKAIQTASNPAAGKEEIIFKNNNVEDRSLEDQIELFSEIIIDIYLESELRYEKRKCTDRP
jgi:ABC-type siderophore export system fused ATPase/permease subunit